MLASLYQLFTAQNIQELFSDRTTALQTVREMIQTQPPVVAPNTPWRIYPDVLAEGVTLPALTFQMISDEAQLTQDGDAGLYMPRVQFGVMANSAIDRDTLGKALQAVLQGFSGLMGSGSPLIQTEVCVMQFDNAIDEYEPDRKLYRRILDFHVIHN